MYSAAWLQRQYDDMHHTHSRQYSQSTYKKSINTINPTLLWLKKLLFDLDHRITDLFIHNLTCLAQVNVILYSQESTSH